MKRRALSFALAIVMLFGLMPTVAVAEGTRTLSLEQVDAQVRNPGDTFAVNVNISGNDAGYFNYGMYIDYDKDLLSVVSVEKGDASSAAFGETESLPSPAFADAIFATNPQTGDGTLAKITFKVNENATKNAVLSLIVDEFCDENDEDIAASFVDITTTIEIQRPVTDAEFVNGGQKLTETEARAEAEGEYTLTSPGEDYYFAGWFSGLDSTYKDANGYYVIAPTEDMTGIAGSELRPRYEDAVEGTVYNALWIQDTAAANGTYQSFVLAINDTAKTFNVYYGTASSATERYTPEGGVMDSVDGHTLRNAFTTEAGASRIKLVKDMTVYNAITCDANVYFDLNDCDVTMKDTKQFIKMSSNTKSYDIELVSSRGMAHIQVHSSSSDACLYYTDASTVTIKNIHASNRNYIAMTSGTVEDSYIENTYNQYSALYSTNSNGTITVTNSTIKSAGSLISLTRFAKGNTITLEGCTLEFTGTTAKNLFSDSANDNILNFGKGNSLEAEHATVLCYNFKEVHFDEIPDSFYMSPNTVTPFDTVTSITGIGDLTPGVVIDDDGKGKLVFSRSYTVTYYDYAGTLLDEYTAQVMEGGRADLSKTTDFADKRYTHGGWALAEDKNTALTSYTVTGDTALYAVRVERGPINHFGENITGGILDVAHDVNINGNSYSIQNAHNLDMLEKMDIEFIFSDEQVYSYVIFSEAANASIASNFSIDNSDADRTAVINIDQTMGSSAEDGFVAKVDLSVTQNGTPVDFNGAVQVKIGFHAEEGKNYRVYYVDEKGNAQGMATTFEECPGSYSNDLAVFTTTHFSTYELREVEVAEGYTAGLEITESAVRAGGNTVNVAIDVTHQDSSADANDTTFNAAEIVVSYDPSLLTPVTTGLAADTFKVDETNGTLTIETYGEPKDLGEGVFTLQFTTCESVNADTTATITLTRAAFADSVDARDKNLSEAALDPASDSVTIQVEAYTVTKDDTVVSGSGEAVKGEDYTFSIKNPNAYCTYTVTATVNGVEVTVTKNADGTYTIAAADIKGDVEITVTEVPNEYDVTFPGLQPADSDGNKATYNTDYSFTLPTISQHQVNYSITIGGEAFGNATESGKVITIPGEYIKGAIAITITSTQTEFNVTIDGSDATWTDDNGGTLVKGDSITVTIAPVPGYSYTVTAKDKNGNEVAVTDNKDNTYTIANIQSDITVTVTKTLIGTVEVTEYLTLDADTTDDSSSSIFLVTYTGDLTEGYIPYCNDSAMYWSEKYDAYCYLVIETTLVAAEENTTVSVKQGTKDAIAYTMNVNDSTLIDAADAQLVYDMYKVEYSDFNTVSMLKFLLADVNGSKKVDLTDAQAIISGILDGTAI